MKADGKDINIFIADDHQLFVEGLKSLLEEEPHIEFLIAQNGEELLDKLPKDKPMIVLLDINMPKFDGLQAMEVIDKSYPLSKVLVLTMHGRAHYIKKFLRLGVAGYILKKFWKIYLDGGN